MKGLFLIALMVCSLSAVAQVDSIPFRGANTIYIKTLMPESEVYTAIGKKLLELGYTFQENERFKTFKTDEKPLPNEPSLQFICSASINEGMIKLSGTLRSVVKFTLMGTTSDVPPFAVEYRTGGVYAKRFKYLNDLAEHIKTATNGVAIAYKKQ